MGSYKSYVSILESVIPTLYRSYKNTLIYSLAFGEFNAVGMNSAFEDTGGFPSKS